MRRWVAVAAALTCAAAAVPARADVTATSCTATVEDGGYWDLVSCDYVSREDVSAGGLVRHLTLSVSRGYAAATLQCYPLSPGLVIVLYAGQPPETVSWYGAGYCVADVRAISHYQPTTATVTSW